jgi:hypothetical protein
MDSEALSIMYKAKYSREITVRTVGNWILALKRHPFVRQLDGTATHGCTLRFAPDRQATASACP